MAGILRTVPAPTAETLAAVLRPVTADPSRAAILCDIDGTLAPIVTRAEEAHVSDKASRLLGRAARRYGLVACISGPRRRRRPPARGRGRHRLRGLPRRRAARARRGACAHLARVRELGGPRRRLHGRPRRPRAAPAARADRAEGADRRVPLARRARRGRRADAARGRRAGGGGRRARLPLGPQGARDPPAGAGGQGPGRARAGRAERGAATALFGGDDATDLDAFAALDALVAEGALDAAVKIGVHSAEGPAGIVEQADQVVDGTDGFIAVLEALVDE